MKTRLLPALALLALLSGCVSYDYTRGHGGDYYRGSSGVQYRYPPGYPYNGPYYYGAPYYYGGALGLYDYPAYPIYRGGYRGGGYRPIDRRPPPRENRRPPPRPGGGGEFRPRPSPSRPSPPRPATPRQSTPSPWRNLNRLKQRD